MMIMKVDEDAKVVRVACSKVLFQEEDINMNTLLLSIFSKVCGQHDSEWEVNLHHANSSLLFEGVA